jgi:NTP pyrophosphatase (non-canonical NTP hydrolase)
MMYYLYHIPGKKIGVTCNLRDRVTRQQGYSADEYEVLLTSDDIDYISDKEIELQQSHGYKVDRQSYRSLINKNNQMKLNVTEQTTTFPIPLNKLKGNLLDNIGLKWQTNHGTFGLDDQTSDWIVKNAKTSMFNVNRCYIYNKAYASEFLNKKEECINNKADCERFDLIRSWAKDKGIYKSGDSRTQFVKLMEEAGELAQAILKNDEPEVVDAIGDMVVVLTNLSELRGYNIEKCIDSAYNVIKSRQGKMINGTFVKSENLKQTL